MKPLFSIILLTLLLVGCSEDVYERNLYANWYDNTSLKPEEKKLADSFRVEQIPLLNEVSIPKFPDAELLIINPEIHGLRGLILVSKYTQDEVFKWYKSKLHNKFSSFKTEIGDLFIEGTIDKFDYNSDSTLFLEKEHIIISQNDKPKIKFITPGYNTVIEIVYRKIE